MNCAIFLFAISTFLFGEVCSFSISESSRRNFLKWSTYSASTATTAGILLNNPSIASAASKEKMLEDLETSIIKMQPIPELLDQNEWDKVRTILKSPPVNYLWNLGDVSMKH